jgi:hypothetical protein
MRSWVYSFQFLLGIASTHFLKPESHENHEHILLSLFFRFPQLGGPGSCIYFLQEVYVTVVGVVYLITLHISV